MPVNASKRLYTQVASECIHEPVQSNTIVVIHPGSLNLRIGRASDTFPVTIPHCVARKRKDGCNIPEYKSSWMVRKEKDHPGANQQKEQGLMEANEALEVKPMDSGEYRPPSSVKQLYSHNIRVKGERTDVMSTLRWTNTDRQPPFIIGNEVLYIKPGSGYSLHWPMRRGHLNLYDGPGGTLSAIMADIELLWGTAIQKYLNIPLKDLKESVCGAFGAGIANGCVVDVGDQKTSICCIEDGISHKSTRLTMEIGGCDITCMFMELLNTLGFNPTIDLTLNPDALLIQELKERLCHFDHNRYGYLEESVQVKRPGEYITKYLIQIGDELVLAPLSLFFPDMLTLEGDHLTHIQKSNQGDPADPHDEFYLRQVQTRGQDPNTKMSKKKDNVDSSKDGADLTLDESTLNVLQDEDSNELPDSMALTDSTKGRREVEEEIEDEVQGVAPPLMGLDDAILYCIDKCESDELKKKMYSCIVVLGGGMNFESTQPWLQYCVWKNMPAHFRPLLETMDVITNPKELDPQIVSWKGGSILACLDTTQELWIKQKEWEQFDVRMLRERAPFVW